MHRPDNKIYKKRTLFKQCRLNKLYCSNKHKQHGMGLVIVVLVLIAIIGLALSVLSADINENKILIQKSKKATKDNSLKIAKELYRLNPIATDVSAAAPFNMGNLCDLIEQSFVYDYECAASPTSPALQVGRDGIVQFASAILSEPGQDVPFGVVDGEAVQLKARAELQRHLRRIASVLENYQYQRSLLHLGSNASKDTLALGGGRDIPQDNFLGCAHTRITLDPSTVLPCASVFTNIPTNTGLFTAADLNTIFNTPVRYQTEGIVSGLISAYDTDGLLADVDLDDPDSKIAGIVAAATPWPRGGGLAGNHIEWVFVRKIQVNE